jgi:hypothetical protein
MALVIEDGSGVPTANSYNTLVEIRAFALDRGVDLSVLSDAALTAFALKSIDYLETFANLFVGSPATITQGLSWPRINVINSDGSSFPSSGAASIPVALKNAESQLCIEQNNGVVLLPTVDHNADGGFVIRRKVDVLETAFSERIGTSKSPFMPAVNRWLDNLLVKRPSGLTAVRV